MTESAFTSPVPWGMLAASLVARLLGLAIDRASGKGGMRVQGPAAPLGAGFMLLIVSWAFAAIVAIAGIIEVLELSALGVVGLLPALPMLFPWMLVRHVLVPLGQVRLAYKVGWLSQSLWDGDVASAPHVAAAWALLNKRGPEGDADEAWLRERLERQPHLSPAGILAHAMLALRRGDEARAIRLCESVDEIRAEWVPPPVSMIARSLRASLSAEQGDWQAVIRCAEVEPSSFRRGRDVVLLAAIGKRLLAKADAPSNFRLWLTWAVSPMRVVSYPLVSKIASSPRASIEELVPPPPPEPGAETDAVSTAHASLVQLVSREEPASGRELVHLCQQWDAALRDAMFEKRVLVRSLELGVADMGGARASFVDGVAKLVADLAMAGAVPLSGGEGEAPAEVGSTLDRARRLVRDRVLIDLELACEATRRRAIEKRALPAVDEWADFLSLRAKYERVAKLSGEEGRRLSFIKLKADVCKLAVWLFNERGEKAIANGMFRFLLREATALGDEAEIELQTKNSACE